MLSSSPPLQGSWGHASPAIDFDTNGRVRRTSNLGPPPGQSRPQPMFAGFRPSSLSKSNASSAPRSGSGGHGGCVQPALNVVHGFSPVSTLFPPGSGVTPSPDPSPDAPTKLKAGSFPLLTRTTPGYSNSANAYRPGVNPLQWTIDGSSPSELFPAKPPAGQLEPRANRENNDPALQHYHRPVSTADMFKAGWSGVALQDSPFAKRPSTPTGEHVQPEVGFNFTTAAPYNHANRVSVCPSSPISGLVRSQIAASPRVSGLLRQQLSKTSSPVRPEKEVVEAEPRQPLVQGAHCPLDLLLAEASTSAARANAEAALPQASAECLKDTLLSVAQDRHPMFHDPVVRRAYNIAASVHTGAVRNQGEPYLAHCVETALELAEWGLEAYVVAAALLHGCLDDSMMTEAQLRNLFDDQVVDLIVGVSKLRSVSEVCGASVDSLNDVALDQLRTLLLAMTDVRVLLIKLTDRLNRLRALHHCPDRAALVAETRSVYVPLANCLGMWNLKCQLEDCCFQFAEPAAHAELTAALAAATTPAAILTPIATLAQALEAAGVVPLDMVGRNKNLYGVYTKMQKKGKALDDIHDVRAFRVVVRDVGECYRVLEAVHALWPELSPGSTKDYIADPKANGYQSLHTVVRLPDGQTVEVQIRTQHMHHAAEHGVAAHWRYKECRVNAESPSCTNAFLDRQVTWARFVLSWRSELNDHKLRIAASAPVEDIAPSCACTFPEHRPDCCHGKLASSAAPAVRRPRARSADEDPAGSPLRYQLETDPLYVLLLDGDKVDVKELPPMATVARLRAMLDAVRPMQHYRLLVNREEVEACEEEDTLLAMGDQVELVLDAERDASPGSSPPGRGLDLSPAAVQRQRQRLDSLLFDRSAAEN